MNYCYRKKLDSQLEGCSHYTLLPTLRACIGFGVVENLARFKDDEHVLKKIFNTIDSLRNFQNDELNYIFSLIYHIKTCKTRIEAFSTLSKALESNTSALINGLEILIRRISLDSSFEDRNLVNLLANKLKFFIVYSGILFDCNESERGIIIKVYKAKSGYLLLYEKVIIETDLCRDKMNRMCEPFLYFPKHDNPTSPYEPEARSPLLSQFQTKLNSRTNSSLPINTCTEHRTSQIIEVNCGSFHCKTCIINNIKTGSYYCECDIELSEKLIDELSIAGSYESDDLPKISMNTGQKIIIIAEALSCVRCGMVKNPNEFIDRNTKCCIACQDNPTDSQIRALQIMNLNNS